MSRVRMIRSPQAPSTEETRFNALRHGVLSRYTVLPWEDAPEYEALLNALVAEHAPQGPTEEHLVEELAGVMWRKRRLRVAELAAQQRGLFSTLVSQTATVGAAVAHQRAPVRNEHAMNAVRATEEGTRADLADVEADVAMTARALAILGGGGRDPYSQALAALRDDTRGWWEEVSEESGGYAPDHYGQDPEEEQEEEFTADAEGLRRFLEGKVARWYAERRAEIAARPQVRLQAYGEAGEMRSLERLARYEVHLDRKLERTLAMLLRLKDLRQAQHED